MVGSDLWLLGHPADEFGWMSNSEEADLKQQHNEEWILLCGIPESFTLQCFSRVNREVTIHSFSTFQSKSLKNILQKSHRMDKKKNETIE